MLQQLPERGTLADEVAKVLRQAIFDGQWQGYLPSERLLSEELQVSRETLRGALQALEKEGLIQSRARARRAITHRATPAKPADRVVAILSPIPLEQWELRIIIRTERLRKYLASAHLDLVIKHGARFLSSRHHNALQALVSEVNAACWILSGSTLEVQQWFAEHGIPAIVMGPGFEQGGLPSIDLDVQSAVRHAAGLLLSRRHQRIALVVQEPQKAGDHYGEVGLHEAYSKIRDENIYPILIRYDHTLAGLRRAVDRVFLSKHPPTALIAPAKALFSIVLHLAQRDLIASRDYAFISRDDDPMLEYMTPTVARYSFNPANMAHRLFLAVMKIVNRQHHAEPHLRLMPQFVPGESMECRGFGRASP